MATTQAFTANNVVAPAAPPSSFIPNANGFPVPTGKAGYTLTIDTTGLPPGAPLGDFAVEYLSGGQWVQEVLVTGALTGPYKAGSELWTLGGSFGITPSPTKARIRVDSCPGYTFPSVGLSLY